LLSHTSGERLSLGIAKRGSRKMNKESIFENLTPKMLEIINSGESLDAILANISHSLHNSIDYYDWVGFYIMENGKLELGPYVGAATDHTTIEVGQGICGQAADLRATFVVDDVTKEDNYLSCSINVKSEIVVPIFKGTNVFGEIDIDSHTPSAFDESDKVFLEWLAKALSSIL